MSRTTLLATPAHPLSAASLAHEDGLLAQVKDALDRMDQGRYGECQDCGETIDAARPPGCRALDHPLPGLPGPGREAQASSSRMMASICSPRSSHSSSVASS